MKKLIILLTVMFSLTGVAQELKLGEIYAPLEIEKLLGSTYSQLKNPNCLKDYTKSSDFIARHKQGSKIRTVTICSQGKNLRFNIRYTQMGGSPGSMSSINTIVYCDLNKPMASSGCYDY